MNSNSADLFLISLSLSLSLCMSVSLCLSVLLVWLVITSLSFQLTKDDTTTKVSARFCVVGY